MTASTAAQRQPHDPRNGRRGEVVTEQLYDGWGNRLLETRGGETTHYSYDTANRGPAARVRNGATTPTATLSSSATANGSHGTSEKSSLTP
jgi:hypothetical protein